MIAQSLLDNDQYKLTMAQAVFHNYADYETEYRYKCRNYNETFGKLTKEKRNSIYLKVMSEIYALRNLKFTDEEYNWVLKRRYINPTFAEFLKNFQLKPELYVYIYWDEQGLEIDIKGPWIETIWFEVPILYIISEVYHRFTGTVPHIDSIDERVGEFYNVKFPFADFGTRRRASYKTQDYVIRWLSQNPHFVGTSNMHFAMKYNLTPIGTMAHEWIMAHQQLTNIGNSQKMALDVWSNEFRGDLGIALSDTLGFKQFLNDFDMYASKLFDGCRHDSGDPYEWTEMLIEHYERMKIDPRSKTAVFSDNLNLEKAKELHKTFKDRIKTSFGIGTHLTNYYDGVKALQIVIKMTKFNGGPVIKISDDPSKVMCYDKNYEVYVRSMVL